MDRNQSENELATLTQKFLSSKNNIGHFNRDKNNLNITEYESIFEPIGHYSIAQQIFEACSLMNPSLQSDLRNMNVLDVGCSIGSFTYSIKNEVKSVVGIDIEEEAILSAQAYVKHKNYQNLNFYLDNAIHLDKMKAMYAQSFDLIIIKDVVEHITDLENFSTMMNNLKKLLKPEGIIFIECPNYMFPYEPHLRIPIIPMSSKKLLFLTAKLFGKIKKKEDVNFVNHLNIVSTKNVEKILMLNGFRYSNAYEEWKLKKIFYTDYSLCNSYKYFQPFITFAKAFGLGKLGYLFFKTTKLYPTLWYVAQKA